MGFGGERGIRTLDTLLAYTHFPGALLKPLGHLSFEEREISENYSIQFCQSSFPVNIMNHFQKPEADKGSGEHPDEVF